MSTKETKKPHHFSAEARALKEGKAGSKNSDSTYIPDMEFDPQKTYEFKMTSKVEGTSFVPRSQKVWCETQQRIREIRYCKTEKSPFLDEQDENSREERLPLQFTKGSLKLDGSNAPAIKYLLASDQIRGRKKTLPQNTSVLNKYYLVDNEAVAKVKLATEEQITKARIVIRDADDESLDNFVRSEFRKSFTDEKDLRNFAYSQVPEFAEKFLKQFNNPLHKLKAEMQVLFERGYLTDTKGVVTWSDTKGEILTFVTSKSDGTRVRADEALAKWILEGTEDSKAFQISAEEKLA